VTERAKLYLTPPAIEGGHIVTSLNPGRTWRCARVDEMTMLRDNGRFRQPKCPVCYRPATILVLCCLAGFLGIGWAQTGVSPSIVPASASRPSNSSYVLGPDDHVGIRALDVDEIDGRTLNVDLQGNLDVPLVGRIRVTGLTPDQLQKEIETRLSKYVRNPQVTVTVSEYRSRPFSVVGAVNQPGVYSLTGNDTLVQALSKAGGIRPDASDTIIITRANEFGEIPLPSARPDASGKFSTAEISVKSLMNGKDPRENVGLRPTDVITVPKAELVYVVGAVRKPGGFVLTSGKSTTVLQAISMAEGVDTTSAAKRSRIIRGATSPQRTEIPVNLTKILSGKDPDIPLYANDVLFVPTSGTKNVALRALDAALRTATGMAIYR